MAGRHEDFPGAVPWPFPLRHGRMRGPRCFPAERRRVPGQVERCLVGIDIREILQGTVHGQRVHRLRPQFLRADAFRDHSPRRTGRRLPLAETQGFSGTQLTDAEVRVCLNGDLAAAQEVRRGFAGSVAGKRPPHAARSRGVQVDENQRAVAFRRRTEQGQPVAVAFVDETEVRSRVETGMLFEQDVKPGEKLNLVLRVAPRQRRGFVDIDLLRGEPFQAVGDAVRALLRAKRRQGGPHPGVCRGHRGQSRVVVRFRVVDEQPPRVRGLDRAGKVLLDLAPIVILEQLRVGPVKVRPVQQTVHGRHFSPQSLQEKHGVGILFADLGHDVCPRVTGNHVSSVATEPVHAQPAPEQEHAGHVLPQLPVAVVEFREVFPRHTPRAGRLEFPVFLPREPFRVFALEMRCPSRVIDGQVHEQAAPSPVHRIDHFPELFPGRGLAIEFRHRGIHIGKIQRGKRAPETAHPRVGGRHGMDG